MNQSFTRRNFVAIVGATSAAVCQGEICAASPRAKEERMYGLISKIATNNGKRDDLISILDQASSDLPGCLSYVIAKDSQDENAIWVTEVWESQKDHKESMSIAAVQEAIGKGRPLIAEFTMRVETEPSAVHPRPDQR